MGEIMDTTATDSEGLSLFFFSVSRIYTDLVSQTAKKSDFSNLLALLSIQHAQLFKKQPARADWFDVPGLTTATRTSDSHRQP